MTRVFEFDKREKLFLLILSIIILTGVTYLTYTKINCTKLNLEAYKKENTQIEEVFAHTTDEENTEMESANIFIVHVSGAVLNPGVYELEEGARVIDAIEIAGGITDDANQHAINLAKKVIDEEKIYVPRQDEVIEEQDFIQSKDNKININSAKQSELEELPGIGTVLAKRIIEYREQNGKFRLLEDIMKVSGIGTKKYENIKDLIIIN